MTAAGVEATLTGYTVAVTDFGAEHLAALLRQRGAAVAEIPLLRVVPAHLDGHLRIATRRMVRDPVAYVVVTSTAGWTRWLAAAAVWGLSSALSERLKSATILSVNGALPGEGHRFRDLAETVDWLVDHPVAGRRVAMTVDEPAPVDTIAALHAVGTEVLVVPTRRLALPPGLGPVHQLARMVIQREAHAVTFTTVAAVTALLDVTRRTGRRSLLLRALAKDVVVATADARSAAPFLELDIPAFWPTGGDTTDELGRLLFDALVARRRDFRADGRWIAVQGDALLVDSGAILLPPRPAAVLRTLADYPERVLSRSAIEQLVPLARHGGPLAVEQAVRRLRAALGSYDWLVATVPGRGYRLAVDPDVVKPG